MQRLHAPPPCCCLLWEISPVLFNPICSPKMASISLARLLTPWVLKVSKIDIDLMLGKGCAFHLGPGCRTTDPEDSSCLMGFGRSPGGLLPTPSQATQASRLGTLPGPHCRLGQQEQLLLPPHTSSQSPLSHRSGLLTWAKRKVVASLPVTSTG